MVADPSIADGHVSAADDSSFDQAHRYALAPDLAVVPRGAGAVQLGTEPSRRVLVTGLTADAIAVLQRLRTPMTLGAALHHFGDDSRSHTLLADLAAAGFLVPVDRGARSRGSGQTSPLAPERLTLTHQYGPAHVGRVIDRRADAVVVIEGWDPTATALSNLLDASGVGRLYRPTRLGIHRAAVGDSAEGRPGRENASPPAAETTSDAVHDPRPPAVIPQRVPLALRHYYPPSHTPPDLVVLAGARHSDRGRAAALVADMVPHLPVRAGNPRGIVGPLVLPGRSACLNCLDRHRSDRDPDWRVATGAAPYASPTPLMTQSVAALAARQVLDLIDGMNRPASVDATLEYDAGRLGPARRSWPQHPDCGCRLLGRD